MQVIPKRARRFQFTLNDFDKYGQLADAIKSKTHFKAMISCKETAPSTGHVHAHIYALFSNPVRWRQVCGEHIEVCKGSHKANIAYICKNGDVIEKINLDDVRDTKMTAAELMTMSLEDVKQLSPALLKTWNTIRYIDEPLTKATCYKPNIKVYYIWNSVSGVGKSKFVYDHLKDDDVFDYIKYVNGFWMGTRPGVKIAWYDEFRDSHMKTSEFLNFIDYYVHPMNIKGGSHYNRYETIYITSIYSPDDIYKNISGESRRQWMRRMEIIHIDDDDKTMEDNLAWK